MVYSFTSNSIHTWAKLENMFQTHFFQDNQGICMAVRG